jgi:hypothetical protein
MELILKKSKTEELWFKSIKFDDNHKIIEYCWTPYYEGVDTFDSIETLIRVTSHLDITYIIEIYEN